MMNELELPREKNWSVAILLTLFGALLLVVVCAVAAAIFFVQRQGKTSSQFVKIVATKELHQSLKKTYQFKNDKERELVTKAMQSANPNDSVSLLQEAIQINPSSQSYLLLGTVYFSIGQKDKAQTAFEQSLQIDDHNTDVLSSYGYLLGAQFGYDQFDKGKALLEKAIQIDDANAQAYFHLGLLWAEKGDYEQARKNIDFAAAIDPEQGDIKIAQESIHRIMRP